MSQAQTRKELDMAFKLAISNKHDLNTELALSLRKQDMYKIFLDYMVELWPKYRSTRFNIEKTACQNKYASGMLDLLIRMKEVETARRYETAAQKSAREADVDKVKQMDNVLDGKVDSEFSDLGIVTDDDSVREVIKNATEIEEDKFVQD